MFALVFSIDRAEDNIHQVQYFRQTCEIHTCCNNFQTLGELKIHRRVAGGAADAISRGGVQRAGLVRAAAGGRGAVGARLATLAAKGARC